MGRTSVLSLGLPEHLRVIRTAFPAIGHVNRVSNDSRGGPFPLCLSFFTALSVLEWLHGKTTSAAKIYLMNSDDARIAAVCIENRALLRRTDTMSMPDTLHTWHNQLPP